MKERGEEHERGLWRDDGDAVADEIRHHLLERADALEQEGWSRSEALREAQRRFGDVERIRRGMRHRRRWWGMELVGSLGSDFRFALRGVRADPVFALALVTTLALGIGAAASIFAAVDALLLRPLPYRDADRLVELNHAGSQGNGYTPGIATARIAGWREAAAGLADGWVAWSHGRVARTDGEGVEPLEILAVTPGADTLLGIPLLHGRSFSAEDARVGSPDVAVLGREYFERLGADPGVIGSTIRLESGPVTIIGVLRGGIRFPTWGGRPDLWLPIRENFSVNGDPLQRVTGFWARLRPGLSVEAAQGRANVIAAALHAREPVEGGWDVHVEPIGAHRMSDDIGAELWTLSATVMAIFLIAWVNGINLLLVRANARRGELAVRAALGCSRLRLMRQHVVEGIVWGGLGGIVAIALAVLAVNGLNRIVPGLVLWSSPYAIRVEARTLGFIFAVTLLVGTVLGLVPAFPLDRKGAVAALARRMSGGSKNRRRLRNGLVVAQLALSMTLLAGAGLFVKSFARLATVDPGYEHERIAFADIGLSRVRYADARARSAFFHRLEEMLEAHPGIEAASRADVRGFRSGVRLETKAGAGPASQPLMVPWAVVAPDYLEVMGADLVAGRGFRPTDAGTDAVIIDRDLARFLWSENPVGRRFRLAEVGEWLTVIGVVDDLRILGRDQRDGPHLVLQAAAANTANAWVEVVVRSSGDPGPVLGVIREAVRELDPEQTVWRLRTADSALAEEEAEPRFLVLLMSVLATIAVALTAVGLYGVLAFTVAQRGGELAVRMALGAQARGLQRMVLREGMAVAAAGTLLGLGGAFVATRSIEHLLYEVPPHDPLTFILAVMLFLGIAALAALVPARRATRVEPAEVMRRVD